MDGDSIHLFFFHCLFLLSLANNVSFLFYFLSPLLWKWNRIYLDRISCKSFHLTELNLPKIFVYFFRLNSVLCFFFFFLISHSFAVRFRFDKVHNRISVKIYSLFIANEFTSSTEFFLFVFVCLFIRKLLTQRYMLYRKKNNILAEIV